MNELIKNELKKRNYNLIPVDMKDLKSIKNLFMRFDNETYKIEGIGNLMIINMSSIFNLMKMNTIVITPQYKDLSFINIDHIKVNKKNTLIIEMYESCINETDLNKLNELKDKYKNIKEYKIKEAWYDSIRYPCSISKITNDKELNEIIMDYLNNYLDLLSLANNCDYDLKNKKNSDYVNRLIEEGGTAVNSLNKIIGKEKCSELIRRYMFNIID